jgi:ligand-binding sensor domain-containing protein
MLKTKFLIATTLLLCLIIINLPIKEIKAYYNSLIFDSITIEDGLSQNIVRCIVQDHYGYMWFGTEVGLNKYDGINIEIYSVSENFESSKIQTLYESSTNDLWIGTSSGLYKYNRQKDTFTSYFKNNHDIKSNSIKSIHEDNDGMLWIGTTNGLIKYNLEVDDFHVYFNDPINTDSVGDNFILSVYTDSSGTLWIGTPNGLSKYISETDSFITYINIPDDEYSICSNYINTIYEDRYGILWIGTSNGLSKYDPVTNIFTNFSSDSSQPTNISDNYITSICEDSEGYLWIGTMRGLNRLHIESNSFINFKYNKDDSNGIQSDNITSLYKDYSGMLWIGTINGINTLNLSGQAFNRYPDITNSVSGILKATEDNLWLWVGEDLILFNNKSKCIEKIYTDIFKDANYTNPTLCDICLGKDGTIWFGTISKGLINFNPITNTTNTYVNDPENDNSLKNNSVISLYIDNSGIIWIATRSGLCSYNTETLEFFQFNGPEYPDAIRNGRIYSICQSTNGDIYLGAEYDMYVLDIETNQIKLALSSIDFNMAENSNGVETTYQDIETIYQDSSGLLWIGAGYGLFTYDIEKMTLSAVNLGEVLLVDFVNDIIEDKECNIWFTNRQGLYSFSPAEDTCIQYGLNDGLIDTSFCEESGYITEDGELFFGSMRGLISFYPEDIIIDTNTPNVIIKSFNLIDKQLSLNEAIEDIREIELLYYENSFVIDFVALYYNSPESFLYTYKLDGYDDNWQYCKATESFTKYTNIPAGEYTFMVKASNSDGVWNETTTYLKIIIDKPYWQTWWFVFLLTVAGSLAILLIIRLRIQAARNYSHRLEIQVDKKTIELVKISENLKQEVKLHKIAEDKLQEEMENRLKYTRALVHELKTPLIPLIAASDYLLSNIEKEPLYSFVKCINTGALNLSSKIDILFDLHGEKWAF